MAKKVKGYTRSDGTKVKAHVRKTTAASRHRVATKQAQRGFAKLLSGASTKKHHDFNNINTPLPRLKKMAKRKLNKMIRTQKRKNKKMR